MVEVLLGVTGSIAAYKSLELLRLFRSNGWNVTVILTRSAAKLIGIESFRALSGREVAIELFPGKRIPSGSIEHIDLATRPDLTVIAPATANIIGKLTHGIADDLLSTILLAIPQEKVRAGRVIFAPAMNSNMWFNPVVQENVKQLSNRGYRFVYPESGELACGVIGTGRMAPPDLIFQLCKISLTPLPNLNGVSILITAGRTEEPLDPVRVFTNRATGLMGTEIAKVLMTAGANTKLVAGEVAVPLPPGTIRVRTADEMAKTVLNLLPEVKILIMCAAVADYQPVQTSQRKIHEPSLNIKLKKTKDILKLVSESPHRPLIIGFSQDDTLTRARKKLRDKKMDLIVANPINTAGAPDICPTIIFASGKTHRFPKMSKSEFAVELVKIIANLYYQQEKRSA